ncbi:MAG: hypothetical protein B7Z66_02655 [Chromatiales bacterium 21-64-14]|nr:MAG: hypothetical protein B7Z66_02655 [Chromatiales bacterium 21-64-14]HQU14523.1 cation/multidrug efflux pump [Gammaproteobacteria bacterium]
MNGLELIAALAMLVGLLLLYLGGRGLRRRRLLLGGLAGAGGLATLAAAGLLMALAVNLYTYQRLTAEQPVAELAFSRLGPQHYRVRLVRPGVPPANFELEGDQWQLDARILKWRGVAVLLGLDTRYRLERLSGRYASLVQARDGFHSVYDLAPAGGLDPWSLARRYERWLPWVDAYYGSATYLPMADGAVYTVSVTTSGLLARAQNRPARRAVEGWR